MTNKKQTQKQPKKTKTIYKKTLTRVYKYVLEHKRTEIKVAAREMRLNRESVRMALTILKKAKFIKERKYSDIGVSYFYPCDDRLLFIYLFNRYDSFLIVLTSKLDLYYMCRYPYIIDMMPDDNLHHFLKRTRMKAINIFGELPPQPPYVALPGVINEKTDRIESQSIPELVLLDVLPFIRELLVDKHTKMFTYDIQEIYDPYDEECQRKLGLMAFEATFIRKKKNLNNQNKHPPSDK